MDKEQGFVIFSLLQSGYLGMFWFLLEKKGFRLSWFAPLALGLVVATFITVRYLIGQWMPSATDSSGSLGIHIMTAVSLVVIYPIHALLTLWASKLLKLEDMAFFERLIWRGGIIVVVMAVTVWIIIAIMMAVFFAFNLITSAVH